MEKNAKYNIIIFNPGLIMVYPNIPPNSLHSENISGIIMGNSPDQSSYTAGNIFFPSTFKSAVKMSKWKHKGDDKLPGRVKIYVS